MSGKTISNSTVESALSGAELGAGVSMEGKESRPKQVLGGRRGMGNVSGLAWLLAMVAAMVGCAGFAFANGTVAPLLLAFFLGILGLGSAAACFRIGSWEVRAFALMYGACLMAGGGSQFYAELVTGALQNASDAETFFEFSNEGLTGDTLDDLRKTINAPGAVLIWQTLYSLVIRLRMPPGPWAGVILNAAVVGWTAVIIVATAREVFGSDDWRLRRVTMLCGSCGMFWLFGAIFVRDCFALFANSLMVWVLVRVLARGSLGSLVLLGAVGSAYWLTMREIRGAATMLVLLFFGVAAGAWLIASRAGVLARGAIGSLVAVALVLVILNAVKVVEIFDVSTLAADAYIGLGADSAGRDSVGAGLLTSSNPLIRVSAGVLFLHLLPVPLWSGFEFGGSEYLWLKSFQGIFMALCLPLTLTGILGVFRLGGRQKDRNYVATLFLAFVPATATLLVAMTSMETRHHGQFLAAYLILAAVHKPGRAEDSTTLKRIQMGWFSIVVVIHAVWLLLKFR